MEIEEFTETLSNHTIPLHEMKPIVLGLYCYRQMSDKFEYYMNKVLLNREYDENLGGKENWCMIKEDDQGNWKEINTEPDENLRIEFRDIVKSKYAEEYTKIEQFAYFYLRMFINPENLFSEIVFKLNRGQEIYEDLVRAFEEITEELINYVKSENTMETHKESLDKLNIFQDINLKLFEDKKEILNNLVLNINELDFNMDNDEIVISNYEYLTNYFVEHIKESGYYNTIPSISKLIAKIVSPTISEYCYIYDPTIGTGSIYIEILKEIGKIRENKLGTLSADENVTIDYDVFLCGNEINQSVYNQTIMNFIIHNIPYYNISINNKNTLDTLKEYPFHYNIATADLPLGLKYSGNIEKLSEDPRFKDYGKLSKRNTDFLFILDMLYNLSDNGILVTTVSPQTLFAEGPELNTRKRLIENNYIDAVIKLAPIHYNKSIEPNLLILKKNRKTKDILFIDASKEFIKHGWKNELSIDNINKITQTYNEKTTIEKFSYLAPIEEIKSNNYNLTTKMYVDTFEETKIDIEELNIELNKIKQEKIKNDEQLKEYFKNKENIFGF